MNKQKKFIFRPRVQTYHQDVSSVKHVNGNAGDNFGDTNVNKDAEWFV